MLIDFMLIVSIIFYILSSRQVCATQSPTSLPSSEPSSRPSGQPSSQPSRQPTTQPTSAPSAGSSTTLWTLQVTQIDDASFNPVTDKNPCCASHWTFASSCTACTLRAAFAFCFTEVPWETGSANIPNITMCNIEFTASEERVTLDTPITIPSTFTERKNVSIHIIGANTYITQSKDGERAFSIVNSIFSSYPSRDDSDNYGLHVKFSGITFHDVGDAKLTSTAVSNTGIDGAALYVEQLKSIVINSCVFIRNRGRLGAGLYAVNGTSVSLSDTIFRQNYAVSGGGVFIRNVDYSIISNCTLTDNRATQIGAGLVLEASNSTEIRNSIFESNGAGSHGGAISIHKSMDLTKIIDNTLTENSASYGSALFLQKANKWTFSGNTITRNSCLRYAGTVRWVRGSTANQDLMAAAIVDSGNVYSGNIYGTGEEDSQGISTEVYKVTVFPSSLTVSDYVDEAPLVATADMTDYYGTHIPDEDAAMSLTVQSSLGHGAGCSWNEQRATTGFVGSTSGVSSNGTYKYDGFGALCLPGGFLNASIAASFSVADTNFPLYYEVTGQEQLTYDGMTRTVYGLLNINFRRCVAGEYYDFRDSNSRKRCLQCQNSYTVADTSTNGIIECEECPNLAEYCYSDKIILRKGTWRYSYYSSTIFECPMYDSCKGGDAYGNDSCLQGSTGPLCGVCMSGYAKSSDGEHCLACSSWSINPGAAFLIPIFLLGAIVVGYIIYQTYRIRKHHRLINIVYPAGHGGAGNEYDNRRLDLQDASGHAAMAGVVSGGNNLHHHDDLLHEERRSMQEELKDTYHAAREALFELHDKLHIAQSEIYEQMMKMSGKVKILFGTYQILVLLPSNFRLSEPFIGPAFKEFCNTFMFMHFDVMRALPLSCLRSWTYLDSMRAITSIPLALTFVLIVTYLLYVRFYAYVYKPSSLIPTTGLEGYFRRDDERIRALPEAEEAFEKEVMVMRQNMLSRFLFVAVLCSYMSVPHVLLSAIKVFDCVDIDPLNEVEEYSGKSNARKKTVFLRADLSVSCNSREYDEGKAYVIFMCILYPLIFSVIYVALFMRARHIAHMARRHNSEENRILNVSAAIRFLFLESYKPRLLVWELVDLSKRLLLCCSIYSMQPGTSLQTMAALMICGVYYKLQCYYRPYLKRNDNALAEMGYAQIVCTIFVLFLFRNQTPGDYREASAAVVYTTLDILLVWGNCFLMTAILYLFATGCVKHFRLEPSINRVLRKAKKMVFKVINMRLHEEERPLNPSTKEERATKEKKNGRLNTLEDTVSPLRVNEAGKKGFEATEKQASNPGDSIDAMQRRIIARTYINDIVGKVRRFRTFNKDHAQLRHKKLSQRRKLEYDTMRRDFQELLHKLNSPNNDIVQVLLISDESTLDELNEHKRLLEDALTDAENQLHDVQAYKKEVIIESGLPYDKLQNLGDATRFTRDDYRYFAEPAWLPPEASIDDNRLDRTWLRPAEHLDPRESRGLVGEHEFIDVTQSAMANRGLGENSDQFALSDSDRDESDTSDESDYEYQDLDGLVGTFPEEPATPAVQEQRPEQFGRPDSVMFSVTSTSDGGEDSGEGKGWGDSDSVSSIDYSPGSLNMKQRQQSAASRLSDSSEESEEKFGMDSDSDMDFSIDLPSSDAARRIGAIAHAKDGFMLSSSELSDSDDEDYDFGGVRQAESTTAGFDLSDDSGDD